MQTVYRAGGTPIAEPILYLRMSCNEAVRNVEYAGAFAHRLVLGADARVLDRHLPNRQGH